jgi:hypothetical protein
MRKSVTVTEMPAVLPAPDILAAIRCLSPIFQAHSKH